MTRLRTVLVLGVAVVGVVGAAATAWAVNADPENALRGVLAVQGGTVVALAVAVWVLLGPTVARLDELIEALHGFARGERHTRVNPADFAGLADVARAVNDVGASLCENDDPNLGPVQKKPRDKPIRRPGSDSPRPSASSPGSGGVRRAVIVDGDSVGEVRRRRVEPAPAPEPAADTAPSTVSSTSSTSSTSSSSSSTSSTSPSTSSTSSTTSSTSSTPSIAPSSSASSTPDSSSSSVTVGPKAEAEPKAPATASSPDTSEAETVPPTPIASTEGVSEPRLSSKARRKQKKGLTARPAPATTSDNADVASDDASDDGDGSLNVEGGAVSGEGTPVEAAADTVDTVEGAGTVEGATDNGAAVADDGNTTVVEAAPSELPTREDLLALFDEFRREKRGAGQSDGVDVDFDAFADTILAESERLVAEHQCRGVRFEVAVAEGEVSLRPRLLR